MTSSPFLLHKKQKIVSMLQFRHVRELTNKYIWQRSAIEGIVLFPLIV